MSHKRAASDRSDENMNEDYQDYQEEEKTLPHRSKMRQVMQDWLEMLTTTTNVSKFNVHEERRGRRGVGQIYPVLLKSELDGLFHMPDIAALDAKVKKIDSHLALHQRQYEEYATEYSRVIDVRVTLGSAILAIEKARKELPDLKNSLLKKPSPSEYAHPHNWIELQSLPNPMLCMRPVKCRGPPIFLLHRVFAEYLSRRNTALPATRQASTALRVAKALCNTMGDYFSSEDTRRAAFLQIINPLFSQWRTTKEVTAHGDTASTRSDATISLKGVTMVLIEIKSGAKGNAYMQASRGYEVTTEELTEANPRFLARGAPTFIACLTDDELRIAGGFRDGKQVVVEPLSCSLIYPDSREDGRVMQLAQNLFALSSCLLIVAREIASKDPLPATALGCPRVFSEVHANVTNQNERLEFIRPRKDLWETKDGAIDYVNLFYDANFGGEKVLAKVVCRSYGKDVHAHLAARHMAPQLYGTSKLHDLANIVVMELLEDGWMRLSDYRTKKMPRGIPSGPRRRLLDRLEDIIDCLEAAGMVHGDFRAANIMFKPREEDKAMLIDFDWAGNAGEVRYPVARNNGFGYPGEAGGPIGMRDDRQFYETWKEETILYPPIVDFYYG